MTAILNLPDQGVDARQAAGPRGAPRAGRRRRGLGAAALICAALAACGQSRAPQAGPIAQTPAGGGGAGAAQPSVALDEPARVALLTPLGASDPGAQAAARAIADGARLAAAERPGLITLDERDTFGRPDAAGAAVREASAAGASVVLGPLFGANAASVREAAKAAGLSAISFSNTPSAAGDGVWLAGLLAGSQADALLRHASRRAPGALGLYYPDTAPGQVARDALLAAAPGAGLSIQPITAYPRSFEGIETSSLGYAQAHAASGAGAVALPDRGQGLQAAASFLAFHGVGAPRTLLLGFADGAGPEALTENSLRGARFAVPDPRRMADFAARFQARFGRAPGDLAWIGYDAASAAAQMVSRARASGDATPFGPEDIADPDGFEGVAGRLRFTPDGLN
ncbi:MAG: hypothetical protein AAF192_17605, partial [Pseudomonadota bacterium]